jgi:hypothetical protein
MTWDAKRLFRPDRPVLVFWALAALSAAVYVAAALALRHSIQVSTLEADEAEYWYLSGDLIHGRYAVNLRRPPVHLAVVGLFRWITGDHLFGVQLLVALFFSLCGPFLYLVTRKMTGHHALAVTAGLCTMFWPPFLYYGNTLYSETTALPLFILMLLCLPRGSRISEGPPEKGGGALLAGLFLGLCMLVRPMYLIFAPLAVGIVFLEEQSRTVAGRRAALVLAGAAILAVPWSVYLSSHAGRPVVVSAIGGETFAGGLNPVLLEKQGTYTTPAGRTSWWGPGKWIPGDATGYLSHADLQLPYEERDLLLRRRAIDWALGHPGSALYLQAAKLLTMWGFHPFWNGAKMTLFGNVPTVALVAVSLAALVRFKGYRRTLSRFWMLPVFVSAVALLSWGSWRFRQPGDLGLLVLAAMLGWSRVVPLPELLGRTAALDGAAAAGLVAMRESP